MRKEQIFRNTQDWYAGRTDYASPDLVDFARRHAGKHILDIGCATGEYVRRLAKCGFECTGIDGNLQYVNEAKMKGSNVYYMNASSLAFPDRSFDTALLFEVLEHVADPYKVLSEAERIARKNVLITVPDCTGFDKLRCMGLTFEHMLEKNHVNFFTKAELGDLLSRQFKDYQIREAEPVYPSICVLPWFLQRMVKRLYQWARIRPLVYFRLYAVAMVTQ